MTDLNITFKQLMSLSNGVDLLSLVVLMWLWLSGLKFHGKNGLTLISIR